MQFGCTILSAAFVLVVSVAIAQVSITPDGSVELGSAGVPGAMTTIQGAATLSGPTILRGSTTVDGVATINSTALINRGAIIQGRPDNPKSGPTLSVTGDTTLGGGDTLINGDVTVNGTIDVRSLSIGSRAVKPGKYVSFYKTGVTGGQEITLKCPDGFKVTSGGTFFLVPDRKNVEKDSQAICGLQMLPCLPNTTSCSVTPNKTYNCGSPGFESAVVSINAYCEVP